MPGSISPWTVVVTGPGRQEVARSALRADVPILIGRAPDCAIMLAGMTVSRYHGRIELAASGIPTYTPEPKALGATVDGDPVDSPTQLGERTLLEIGGFQVRLERARAAAPQKPVVVAPSIDAPPESAETLLDRQIQGVRTHRITHQQDGQIKSQKWEEDWRAVLNNLRVIKAKYGTHPGILDFAISKDEREVIVKLKEHSVRGYAYFCLSRQHPEGKFPNLRAVWLRQVGEEDASHSEPSEGLQDLISRLAPRLA